MVRWRARAPHEHLAPASVVELVAVWHACRMREARVVVVVVERQVDRAAGAGEAGARLFGWATIQSAEHLGPYVNGWAAPAPLQVGC
jgi:hypothetical protein